MTHPCSCQRPCCAEALNPTGFGEGVRDGWSHLDGCPPIVRTLKEIATSALGRGDGVGKEKVAEHFVPKRYPTRPDKDILSLRIRTASATTSPAELRPVERLLEVLEVGLDLSSTERIVGDGVQITADPAGRSDGSGDGVSAGWHSDDG